MKILRGLLPLLALSGLYISANAQQPTLPSLEPVKKLSWLLGDWKTKDKFSMAPGAPAMESDGEAVGKWAVGDRYLSLTIKSDMGPLGTLHGLFMLTYNDQSKKYEGTWFDSMAGQSIRAAGTLEGNTLTLTTEPVAMEGMPPMKMRMAYVKTGDKTVSYKLEMEMEGEWLTQIESVYTKK